MLQRANIINAKLRKDGTGRLIGVAPITLKNQLGTAGAAYVADLKDVNPVELVSGATLMYNAGTGEYDVRPIDQNDVGDIDFGTF